MAAASCTAVGCYLSGQAGALSFPLLTLAGLVDGINPCAIGMIVFLLGYLIVFAGKSHKLGQTAFVYIASVFITYVLAGLFFFEAINRFQQSTFKPIFDWVLVLFLLITGIINLKDFFWPHLGPHLEIPSISKKYLHFLVEKATLPATALLGILVTILETPCSLPIYVGTITLLSQSGMPWWQVAAYFLYYNFLFVLPLIVIAILIWRGQNIAALKEWQERGKKWMKLSIGLVLVGLGLWLGWQVL